MLERGQVRGLRWRAETKHKRRTSPRRPICFLGEFSEELPDEYFDYIISVSVVEHVPTDELGAFMADSARVLRPGGRSSTPSTSTSSTKTASTSTATMRERLRSYLSFADRPNLRLKFTSEPVVSTDVHFRCAYASNSDLRDEPVESLRPPPSAMFARPRNQSASRPNGQSMSATCDLRRGMRLEMRPPTTRIGGEVDLACATGGGQVLVSEPGTWRQTRSVHTEPTRPLLPPVHRAVVTRITREL